MLTFMKDMDKIALEGRVGRKHCYRCHGNGNIYSSLITLYQWVFPHSWCPWSHVTISGQSPVNGNDQCLFWAEEVECDSLALSSTILANMEVCYWMTETQDGNSLENRGFMIMEDSRASYPILHEYEISFCCVKPLRSGGC